jgi:predicted acetyltransferase
MEVDLIPIELDQKPILINLMQKYVHDMSEFTGYDVNDDGLYDLGPHFDPYWEDPTRHPFFVRHDGGLAGFALVFEDEPSCFTVAEFFILRKFRRVGTGTAAAKLLFQRFKGCWRVAQDEKNTQAQAFWRKVIAQVSGGDFQEDWSAQKPRGPMQTFNSSAD